MVIAELANVVNLGDYYEVMQHSIALPIEFYPPSFPVRRGWLTRLTHTHTHTHTPVNTLTLHVYNKRKVYSNNLLKSTS